VSSIYKHIVTKEAIKMAEISKEIIDKALEAVEVAKSTGKIKKISYLIQEK